MAQMVPMTGKNQLERTLDYHPHHQQHHRFVHPTVFLCDQTHIAAKPKLVGQKSYDEEKKEKEKKM